MRPCAGDPLEFLCFFENLIKEGDNPDPFGLLCNDVPDISASDQTDPNHCLQMVGGIC
jgi:hypothetical protein